MFDLNPGQDIPSLRQTLQGFLISDLVHVGITAEDNRSHYVKTIERLDMWLRHVLDGSDWIERLQTSGYWVIRDMDVSSGRPTPMIEPAWVSWRLQTLERLESWNKSTPHRSGTRLS